MMINIVKQPEDEGEKCIQQTHCSNPVVSKEKDEPKMTITQCNRGRRWSCLQCVRDVESGVVMVVAAGSARDHGDDSNHGDEEREKQKRKSKIKNEK